MADNHLRKEMKMFSDILTITVEKIRLCFSLMKISDVFIFSKVVAFGLHDVDLPRCLLITIISLG